MESTADPYDVGPSTFSAGTEVSPCPFGGVEQHGVLVGTILVDRIFVYGNGDTRRTTMRLVREFDDCKVSGLGLNFTLNGSLDYRMELVARTVAESGFDMLSLTRSIAGPLEWALQGHTGVCEVELMSTTTWDSNAGDALAETTTSGTMCGLPFNHQSGSGTAGG